MRIDLALQALLGATQDQARAKAVIDVLRSRLVEEAKRRTMLDGAAPTWKNSLGAVRWDGADAAPNRQIIKPEELASFLAERDPDLVTATITVPADKLEAALEALEFTQVDVRSTAVTCDPVTAGRWLDENSTIAPVDGATGYEVFELNTKNGTTVRGASIPGLLVAKPAPRLVVSLDTELKRRATEAGVADAEDVVADESQPAAFPVTQAPNPGPPPIDYSTLDRAGLVAQCRSAGLHVTGTKAVLARRLQEAVGA